MIDISGLSLTDKAEIADYIREDTLEAVNRNAVPVKPRRSFYTRCIKRLLDIVIGTFGFLACLPINIVIAIVTYFDVGSPIIFRQQRAGLNEKKFTIYKFRNMTNDTDVNGELLPAAERVTKWGRFVRMTSLDELLNFVSIIKGDMSIIGPRPLLDRYADRLNTRHKGMYLVRPGLECPTIRPLDHELSMQERLDNYVWYVENCSFLTDLRLCFRLFAAVFDKKSVKKRSSGQTGGVLGYDMSGQLICTRGVPEKYVDKFCKAHGFANVEEALAARREG